jgi:nucleotide-binding universal stress UspA family protein
VDKIVVGVDGSDESRDALRWAVDEARVHGASVAAVHAWQAPPPVPEMGPMPTYDISILPELREISDRLIASVVKEVVGEGSDVPVEPSAVEGPAAAVLTDSARDADLLVVGSRGHGGFTGLLLGSVGQQLAHHSPCPVVIYRRRDEKPN